MKKWIVALAVAVSLLGTFVATVSANAPVRDTQQLDETFRSRFWSRACGFLVLRHDVGTYSVTLHVANDGGSAREQDSFNTITSTLIAPSTGNSFVDRFGPTKYLYPDGIVLGGAAQLILVGPEQKVPGLPPDVGRVVYNGEIVFIDDNGIPFIDVDPNPVSTNGHFNDIGPVIAAGCAALAG